MTDVQPVILCGGSGSRLWPLSRAGFPKQFLCLLGEKSLFQLTASRFDGIKKHFNVSPLCIVSNEEHRYLVQEQLREIGLENASLLLEPIGKNTAPALTMAALLARQAGDDPVLVALPADHRIEDEVSFQKAISLAIEEALNDSVVVLGVAPHRPETGYGYMQTIFPEASSVATVAQFVEKPDQQRAEEYLRDGNYYWNAGIFILKASVWLSLIEKFRGDISVSCKDAWSKRSRDSAFTRPDRDLFLKIPSDSIDFAVMEKCPSSGVPTKMVPLNVGWSDLGSWEALWETLPKDSANNAMLGDVTLLETSNTLTYAASRLVCLIGVDNLLVVETPDAVLVAKKDQSQAIKHLVARLEAQRRSEPTLHRKVHRPWGWFDTIDEGNRFKVKRISVNPKSSISLQKHMHRAEHWVVVKGTALVVCGEKEMFLNRNQSTYIRPGEMHRLSNPGEDLLEIIEIQSGDYLGEDDIIRTNDDYGRSG